MANQVTGYKPNHQLREVDARCYERIIENGDPLRSSDCCDDRRVGEYLQLHVPNFAQFKRRQHGEDVANCQATE